jgi:hypothetical protein
MFIACAGGPALRGGPSVASRRRSVGPPSLATIGQPQVIERYSTRLQPGAQGAHFDGADGGAVTLNRYAFGALTALPEPPLP